MCAQYVVQSTKEKFDSKILDEGIKQAADNYEKGLKTLFIYAGSYYRWFHRQPIIKKMFVPKMRKHGIRQAVLTLGRDFQFISRQFDWLPVTTNHINKNPLQPMGGDPIL